MRALSLFAFLSVSIAIAHESPPQSASISMEETTALNARLGKARDLIKAHHSDQAISEHLDLIINRYVGAYRESKQLIFCARDAVETLIYVAAAATAVDKGATNQGAEVIGPTWAEAYLMKGFAFVELGNLAAAHDSLQAAVRLSPQNPQYISELAYVTQQQGNSEEALALFASAADAAEFVQDSVRKRTEAGRACRGQAYAFVELKRLDEGEKKYRACLKIDPSDKIAPNELEYIKKVRATNR